MPDAGYQPPAGSKFPRISFGIIVLNGEPFTKYCLRSIYPFAFEIFVVEGASLQAAEISTADGHSLDNTLETLRSFQIQEDPEKKLQIITKDGFWSEKDEQSQAY
ncbi:MAG TPA: glycosyltransferase family A protein, partial [Acidobacteriota bacterium]